MKVSMKVFLTFDTLVLQVVHSLSGRLEDARLSSAVLVVQLTNSVFIVEGRRFADELLFRQAQIFAVQLRVRLELSLGRHVQGERGDPIERPQFIAMFF